MQFREYGTENRETIILLHGGGLSWWNHQAQAEMLRSAYHVVLPILDGHAGSDKPFTTIEDNAAELIAFIDGSCGGQVLLIGGLSLGAQIVLEILSQRRQICRYALVESASVIPSKRTQALIAPAFGCSYDLIRNRRFAKLQFKALHMRDPFFEAYYRDTCQITKADMIAFLRANAAYSLKSPIAETSARVHVFAGEKENGAILRSVKVMRERIPGCTAHILPELFHGEFSLNHPDQYVAFLQKIVETA